MRRPAGERARIWLGARPEVPLALLVLVVFLGLWQGIVRWAEVPEIVIPAPTAIAQALARGIASNVYIDNAAITFSEAALGFIMASIAGICIGALVAQFELLGKIVYPYLVAFQTLPKVAIAPLIVLWFGFGMTSKVIISATVAFFPVLVNVIVGLRGVDRQKVDLLRLYGASKWQTFVKVRFPASLPFVFAGLNVAAIFSLLGAIVGEFVGSQHGLGNMIVQLNFAMDVAGVFGALVILSLLGLILHAAIAWLRRRIVFWAEPDRLTGP